MSVNQRVSEFVKSLDVTNVEFARSIGVHRNRITNWANSAETFRTSEYQPNDEVFSYHS